MKGQTSIPLVLDSSRVVSLARSCRKAVSTLEFDSVGRRSALLAVPRKSTQRRAMASCSRYKAASDSDDHQQLHIFAGRFHVSISMAKDCLHRQVAQSDVRLRQCLWYAMAFVQRAQ